MLERAFVPGPDDVAAGIKGQGIGTRRACATALAKQRNTILRYATNLHIHISRPEIVVIYLLFAGELPTSAGQSIEATCLGRFICSILEITAVVFVADALVNDIQTGTRVSTGVGHGRTTTATEILKNIYKISTDRGATQNRHL
jgi:hypothetical protein